MIKITKIVEALEYAREKVRKRLIALENNISDYNEDEESELTEELMAIDDALDILREYE